MPGYVGRPQTDIPDPSIQYRLFEHGMCGEAFTEKPVTRAALKWLPVCMLSDGHACDHLAADPLGSMESVVRWPVAVDASLHGSAA